MANTKGKIIIGGVLTVIVGLTTMLIVKGVKRKKIIKRIYDDLNNVEKTEEGKKAVLDEDRKHTADVGFSTKFWKSGQDGVMPTKLMPSMYARDIAKKVYNNISWYNDDESKILSALKEAKTKGQLSQVAYQYSVHPLSYGDLGEDVKDALEGGMFTEDKLKPLNTWLASLPY